MVLGKARGLRRARSEYLQLNCRHETIAVEDSMTKSEIRKQRKAEHTARVEAGTTHSQKVYVAPRVRKMRDRGYLGTAESMNAYLSGAPMSSDDY